MTVRVKICGLGSRAAVEAASEAGAAYVGFVHFEKSPRHLDVARLADVSAATPAGVCRVLLTVDADDATLDGVLDAAPMDLLQLHGRETPERVAEVRDRFRLPVMKAVGVAEAQDLADVAEYSRVADQILVDAKPPKGATRPGGNGLSFDWALLQGRRWAVPWMLAGGLTPDNVAAAVRLTGAAQVDVSSGVESAPGIKEADLVRRFVEAADDRATAT